MGVFRTLLLAGKLSARRFQPPTGEVFGSFLKARDLFRGPNQQPPMSPVPFAGASYASAQQGTSISPDAARPELEFVLQHLGVAIGRDRFNREKTKKTPKMYAENLSNFTGSHGLRATGIRAKYCTDWGKYADIANFLDQLEEEGLSVDDLLDCIGAFPSMSVLEGEDAIFCSLKQMHHAWNRHGKATTLSKGTYFRWSANIYIVLLLIHETFMPWLGLKHNEDMAGAGFTSSIFKKIATFTLPDHAGNSSGYFVDGLIEVVDGNIKFQIDINGQPAGVTVTGIEKTKFRLLVK